jgi:hypothetical protein
MVSIRPNKWIVAFWGLAGILSAIDVFVAFKSGIDSRDEFDQNSRNCFLAAP